MYSVLFLAHFFQKLLEVRLGWPLKVNFWGIVEAVLVTGLMSVLSPSQQGQSTRGKSVLCELSDVGDRKMSSYSNSLQFPFGKLVCHLA